MGLVALIIIHAKVIFQLLCKEKIDWDERAPDSIVVIWNTFIEWLRSIGTIRIPRFIFPDPCEHSGSFQLHGFCDSSIEAYCATVYVRRETSSGVLVNLLAAKTKVAPLKKLTIPRLELQAAVLLSKLLPAIVSALKRRFPAIDTYCWSDSEIALCWIKGVNKEWKPWVNHRAETCRDRIPKLWRHIPGKLNPADIATRFTNDKDVSPSSNWFTGAGFLLSERELWPSKDVNIDDVTEELKSAYVKTASHVAINDTSLDRVVNIEKFSCLQRLINVVACVLRFKHNLIAKVRQQELRSGELTVAELNEAELCLIRYEQSLIQREERFPQLEKSLNLFTDETGILRLRGQLENANLEYSSMFPILVRDSHFGELLIRSCHIEAGHFLDTTLSKLRERYWMVRARKVVKRVLRTCTDCRRHQAKGLAPPPPPALPAYRVDADHCFQSTGNDYAGPLFVKSIYLPNNTMYKAYISLFTCAMSRAVHL